MRKKRIGAWLAAFGVAAMPLAAPTCRIDPQNLHVVVIGDDEDEDWDFNGFYWSRDDDRVWLHEFWEFDELWD